MAQSESERRKLFTPGTPQRKITPIKIQILKAIAECRILTTPQVAGYFNISSKAAGNHLRDLFDHELTNRFGVYRSAFPHPETKNDHTLLGGRAPTIHALKPKGAQFLLKRDLVEKEQVKDLPHYGPDNDDLIAHEATVRDVLVWFMRVQRAYKDHGGIETFLYGTEAHIAVDGTTTARPDGVIVYHVKGITKVVALVEADMGTERNKSTWQKKVREYAALYQSDAIEKLTGMKTGRVLVITPNVTRRDKVAGWIEEMRSEVELPQERFWVIEHEALYEVDADEVLIPPDLTKPRWTVPGNAVSMRFLPESVL